MTRSTPHEPGPAVRRFRLRSRLRQLRDAADLTQDQVAVELDWSLSKVIRIEAGTVGIATTDLKALLQLYGVRDRKEIDELVDLARATRKRMWWSGLRGILPPEYLSLIGFESDASTIRIFHTSVVPSLLQVEEYGRRTIRYGSPFEYPAGEVTELWRVRQRRQRETIRSSNPPTIYVVIDEAVLRRRIGGTEVMREQLRQLAQDARLDHVTVRVIPFEVGAYPGLDGSFAVLEFDDPAVDDLLYIDNAPGELATREGARKLRQYRHAFERMQAVALDAERSMDLIEAAEREVAGAAGGKGSR